MREFKQTKQDNFSLVGVAIIVVPVVISVFTPELRNSLGIEEMNGKQIVAFLFYVSFCVLIWQYFLWPALRTDIPDFHESIESELQLSNFSINVGSDGKVTLRTAINIVENGVKKPLSKLRPKNFLITEESKKKRRVATVQQVKPMISPVRIIVLIDNSSSMWAETDVIQEGEKVRKIESVKEAVLKFTNDLAHSKISSVNAQPSYIAFLPFSSEGIFFLNQDNGDIWFPTLPESKDEISRVINSISPDGKTPMNDAIIHALDMLAHHSRDGRYGVVFCLTDGIDNDSDVSNFDLIQSLKEYSFPVITAGYGSKSDIDEDYLLKIALESGAGLENVGAFLNVSPTKLSKVFKRISGDLNNMYEISWYSSFPDPGSDVLSKIQASYVSITGRKFSPVIEKAYSLP